MKQDCWISPDGKTIIARHFMTESLALKHKYRPGDSSKAEATLSLMNYQFNSRLQKKK